MRKLLALFVVATAVGVGFAVNARASSGPTCMYGVAKPGAPIGYNWGEWDHFAQPGPSFSLSVNIAVDGYQTVASPYSHVIGRLGIQAVSGSPQIQTGIWDEDGTAPFFYVEEWGAPDPGTGWLEENGNSTRWLYKWDQGSVSSTIAYAFKITNDGSATGGYKYKVTAPGYTSPDIILNITNANADSTLSNEVQITANQTCPMSFFDFTNPSPYPFPITEFLPITYHNDYYDALDGSGALTDFFPYQDEVGGGCNPGPCIITGGGNQSPVTNVGSPAVPASP